MSARLLGSHVYKLSDHYYNLTTHRRIPLDADDRLLTEELCYHGQEHEAIKKALSIDSQDEPNNLHLIIIPTWRCNLRCSHCFVSHKLKKDGNNNVNIPHLIAFLTRFKERYKSVDNIAISFIGGEPTLNPDLCLKIIEAVPQDLNVSYHMTTNGVMLDNKILQLYHRLKDCLISLDGSEITHNKQRISLDGLDTYATVVQNIRTLVAAGLRDKIMVQASLRSDLITNELGRQYYKTLLMAGVRLDKITIGQVTPNRITPELHPMGRQTLNENFFHRMCCKYRKMSNLVLDYDDSLYADYFESVSASYIGKLTDEIAVLAQRHNSIILDQIPVLNDDKCVKCPVVGACWGYCSNIHSHYKPSEICDQTYRHNKILTMAKNGTLTQMFDKGGDGVNRRAVS